MISWQVTHFYSQLFTWSALGVLITVYMVVIHIWEFQKFSTVQLLKLMLHIKGKVCTLARPFFFFLPPRPLFIIDQKIKLSPIPTCINMVTWYMAVLVSSFFIWKDSPTSCSWFVNSVLVRILWSSLLYWFWNKIETK